MGKKKILFLIRQLGLGGTERRMLDLAESLNEQYIIQIHAVTGLDTTHNIESKRDPNNNRNHYYQKLSFVRRIIKKQQPDIIHAFDADSGIYAKMALLLLGNTTIKLISGMGAEFIAAPMVRNLLKIPWLRPDKFICNSMAGSKFMNTYYKGTVKVDIISNGLDTSRFIIETDKPEWAYTDSPIIGYIGKMDVYKCGERVVEIAKQFEYRSISPLFVIIGNGEKIGFCQSEIAKSDFLTKNVKLLYSIENAARYIQFFDIGLLCSESEGFPNVLLEYMASGVPLITTDVGDVEYITNGGKTGLVVKKYDPVEFAENIISVLSNKERYRELSILGKQRFNSMFTINVMKVKYIELYQKLLA